MLLKQDLFAANVCLSDFLVCGRIGKKPTWSQNLLSTLRVGTLVIENYLTVLDNFNALYAAHTETFYINQTSYPYTTTRTSAKANSSRKLTPVLRKKTTFKHMVQPWARQWQSPFLIILMNKVETEILGQSEL